MPEPRVSSAPFAVLRRLGPGLVFAGAAVGVSHLVQATRAGALAGLAYLPFVLLALLFKYPAFAVAPAYAQATGRSLLDGYRKLGAPALYAFVAYSLATMCIVLAAIVLVTAGLAHALLPVASPLWLAGLILALSVGLLLYGDYAVLDRVIRVAVLVLGLGTVAATVAALPHLHASHWEGVLSLPERERWPFLAALMGWMPAPIEIAVWHSLWTLAAPKRDAASVRLDTRVGYLSTTLLALAFLVLGTVVMHGRGLHFEQGAAAFAAQVISLYVALLGEWARPVLGLAAFAVMLSTTLTVADGYPRSVARGLARLRGKVSTEARSYRLLLLGVAVGAWLIVSVFSARLKALVDLATTLAFVSGPLFAYLNHRVALSSGVVAASPAFRWLSRCGIVFLSLGALLHLLS